jgi:hypothetical protein
MKRDAGVRSRSAGDNSCADFFARRSRSLLRRSRRDELLGLESDGASVFDVSTLPENGAESGALAEVSSDVAELDRL